MEPGLKEMHCITCTEMAACAWVQLLRNEFQKRPLQVVHKGYTFQISPSKNLDDFAQACFGQKKSTSQSFHQPGSTTPTGEFLATFCVHYTEHGRTNSRKNIPATSSHYHNLSHISFMSTYSY